VSPFIIAILNTSESLLLLEVLGVPAIVVVVVVVVVALVVVVVVGVFVGDGRMSGRVMGKISDTYHRHYRQWLPHHPIDMSSAHQSTHHYD